MRAWSRGSSSPSASTPRVVRGGATTSPGRSCRRSPRSCRRTSCCARTSSPNCETKIGRTLCRPTAFCTSSATSGTWCAVAEGSTGATCCACSASRSVIPRLAHERLRLPVRGLRPRRPGRQHECADQLWGLSQGNCAYGPQRTRAAAIPRTGAFGAAGAGEGVSRRTPCTMLGVGGLPRDRRDRVTFGFEVVRAMLRPS
jgi:hypothetical protein